MNSVISLIIGFLFIAFLITIHELGHFIAARLSSITVESFALGWGKAIAHWKRKDTEYRINIFPLGGYCKLKGSDDLARSLDKKNERIVSSEPGSLFSVHPAKRIATYIAGPLANILLALVLFACYFAMDYETFADPNRIVITSDYPAVFATETSAAARAGLQTGDWIEEVDGIPIDDFDTLVKVLTSRNSEEEARFVVRRGTQHLIMYVKPDVDNTGTPRFGVSSYIDPVVGSVDPLSPEAAAGLSALDIILSLNGMPIHHSIDVVHALSKNPSSITMEVRSQDGTYKTISYVPLRQEDGSISMGFSIARKTKRVSGLPPGNAIVEAARESINIIGDTFRFFPSLFSGAYRFDEAVAGPLRISYIIGEMRDAGLRSLTQIVAIISLSLAIANLLPIPALDGGMILLTLWELVRRKSVTVRTYLWFQSIGIAFIFLLIIAVLVGDLSFFLHF